MSIVGYIIFDTISSYDFLNFLCRKVEGAKGSSGSSFNFRVERLHLSVIVVKFIILNHTL